MPISLDISPLNRVVVIAAQGHITPEEIGRLAQDLVEANVSHYGKIIDVTMSTSNLTKKQVERIAAMLRGEPSSRRGPVAFVMTPDIAGFANVFAEVTQDERPIRLFHSLRDARKWLGAQPTVEASPSGSR